MKAAENFGGANIHHLPWSTEPMLKGKWGESIDFARELTDLRMKLQPTI